MDKKEIKKRKELHKEVFDFFGGKVDSFDNFFSYNNLYNLNEVKNKWKDYVDEKQKEDVLDFYIHIPFCRSKCTYCMYPSWVLNNSDQLDRYVDYLVKEFKFFEEVFEDVEFSNLYIGGGTPSILNEKQLEKLLSSLFSNFSFKKKGERTFEANPESINVEKLKIIKKFNLNRISLGVQSTNCQVLNKHNRGYQDINKIKKIIKKGISNLLS